MAVVKDHKGFSLRVLIDFPLISFVVSGGVHNHRRLQVFVQVSFRNTCHFLTYIT